MDIVQEVGEKVLTNRQEDAIIRSVNGTARMRGRTGGYSKEGTPVPIPNTEVKLFGADDTAWVAAWENK